MTDTVFSYILSNFGYIDQETTILFQHALLYPQNPSHPLFSSLPNCSWDQLATVYSSNDSSVRIHDTLVRLVAWNIFLYRSKVDSSMLSDNFTQNISLISCNILIKGDKGSGKTSLLYSALKELDIPCLSVNLHEMTMRSGGDAHISLRSFYRTCVQLAPSALLIDPLSVIAADNNSQRIDRSAVDNALLSELMNIMQDAKSNGVTVIGITSNEDGVLPSMIRNFDETVGCFIPSQQDRVKYYRYISSIFIDFQENCNSGWREKFLDFLSLHSSTFVLYFMCRPSFSWSDINHCIMNAVHCCHHCSVDDHCCCLCLLQSLQRHHSDNYIVHNLSLISNSSDVVMKSLDQMESSLGDFNQIGGNHKLKACLYEYIINPCLNWEEYRYYGVVPPSGILLYGPPGTGKTAISRACSQLGHLNFICPQISDLICKEIGESERRIRQLFDRATRCSPCIIFFDEIESVFKNRKNDESGSGVSKQLLTQLLLQIDNINSNNQFLYKSELSKKKEGFVFIIGATNLPNQLDPALLRPGRLDKHILVPLPSFSEREEIINIYAEDNLLFTDSCSIHDLAEWTSGYSGADIKFLIRDILISSISFDDYNICDKQNRMVVEKDTVTTSLQKVKPSTNKEEYERILLWKPEDNY